MKRIVICADGTWNSPLDENPSNVLKLSRSISPIGSNGVSQTVFYDWGVGSDGKSITGGAFGAGLDKNIKDCYRFIVHNYEPGDELFFFGFSRGAYTVRSLGGFIRNASILKREHADKIENAYTLYKKRTKNSHPNSDGAKAFRAAYSVADLVDIKFVGVWDTVGSLGVPVSFWGLIEDKHLFHDTEPSKIVKCARHAVSIDEHRKDFKPALWSEKDGMDLKQVWFSGCHCDVGGGYEEKGLSDEAFQWILKESENQGLALEPYIFNELSPDPNDAIHTEYKNLYRLRGSRKYRKIPDNSIIHRSVRTRFENDVDGYVDYSNNLRRFLASSGGWHHVHVVG